MKWSLTDMGIYEISGGGRSGYGQQNRVGKTFTMALGGWYAEESGMDVYCNCPTNMVNGEKEHILNIPHIDYNPYELIHEDLYDVYVMTDQFEQVADARICGKKDIRNLGYFKLDRPLRNIPGAIGQLEEALSAKSEEDKKSALESVIELTQQRTSGGRRF